MGQTKPCLFLSVAAFLVTGHLQAETGEMSDLSKFISTVLDAPPCENSAIGNALGVEFELKNGNGPFLQFEASGKEDVDHFELRQPGEGAEAPGVFIAHMVEGSVTRDDLVRKMSDAKTVALNPNLQATPARVEESFAVGKTKVHATYFSDAPSNLISVAWQCD